MSSIQKLFTLKKSHDTQPKTEDTEYAEEQLRITYYQSGYGGSSKAFGNHVTFGVGLLDLFNSFENLCRRQKNEQKKLKQPYLEEQESVRTELKKRETIMTIFDEQNNAIDKKIEDCRFTMVDVKQNPEKYGIETDKRPKAQFYIGLGLLIPITIYLFVFYISASYSAFFKDFETESLTAAIFDSNALTKAINHGWLEALFVGTISFVFMGLGYLVHMFQKIKTAASYFKLAALFVLTFMFDVILAYLIERKIFLFDAVLGEKFTPSIAIQSVNFWGIIFAGFVVYIIWGLVFDFVMKEHENVDKIRSFIRVKKEEVKNAFVKKEILIEKIDKLKGKITELQAKINGFVFPVKAYLHYHYQYKLGWYQSINAELALPNKEKDDLRNKCEDVSAKHLTDLKLDDIDFQNIVFNKN
jgi:hypothetical protein